MLSNQVMISEYSDGTQKSENANKASYRKMKVKVLYISKWVESVSKDGSKGRAAFKFECPAYIMVDVRKSGDYSYFNSGSSMTQVTEKHAQIRVLKATLFSDTQEKHPSFEVGAHGVVSIASWGGVQFPGEIERPPPGCDALKHFDRLPVTPAERLLPMVTSCVGTGGCFAGTMRLLVMRIAAKGYYRMTGILLSSTDTDSIDPPRAVVSFNPEDTIKHLGIVPSDTEDALNERFVGAVVEFSALLVQAVRSTDGKVETRVRPMAGCVLSTVSQPPHAEATYHLCYVRPTTWAVQALSIAAPPLPAGSRSTLTAAEVYDREVTLYERAQELKRFDQDIFYEPGGLIVLSTATVRNAQVLMMCCCVSKVHPSVLDTFVERFLLGGGSVEPVDFVGDKYLIQRSSPATAAAAAGVPSLKEKWAAVKATRADPSRPTLVDIRFLPCIPSPDFAKKFQAFQLRVGTNRSFALTFMAGRVEALSEPKDGFVSVFPVHGEDGLVLDRSFPIWVTEKFFEKRFNKPMGKFSFRRISILCDYTEEGEDKVPRLQQRIFTCGNVHGASDYDHPINFVPSEQPDTPVPQWFAFTSIMNYLHTLTESFIDSYMDTTA